MTEYLNSSVPKSVIQKASNISLILMDVDCVLTDGKMYYIPGPDGETIESKSFNAQDGLGFHILNMLGTIKTGVISAGRAPGLIERARRLQIGFVYQGFLEKEATFDEILIKAEVNEKQVAYIGDDFTDGPLMVRAGLSCAVANARPEIKAIADYITVACGGDGAVREVIEIILKCQNKWEMVLTKYRLNNKLNI